MGYHLYYIFKIYNNITGTPNTQDKPRGRHFVTCATNTTSCREELSFWDGLKPGLMVKVQEKSKKVEGHSVVNRAAMNKVLTVMEYRDTIFYEYIRKNLSNFNNSQMF